MEKPGLISTASKFWKMRTAHAAMETEVENIY
jgi:hypothetical protein